MIYVFFAHGLFMVVGHFFQKLRHPPLKGHPKNLLLYHFRNRSCDLGIFFGTPHVQRHPHGPIFAVISILELPSIQGPGGHFSTIFYLIYLHVVSCK